MNTRQSFNPLEGSQHEHMDVEMATLTSELYAVYQRMESENRAKSITPISEELGVGADRVAAACLVVAVACLPMIEEFIRFKADTDQVGVFSYDHIEVIHGAKTLEPNTLPAFLWNHLPLNNWEMAAVEGKVDLDSLEAFLKDWACANITGWREHTEKQNESAPEPGFTYDRSPAIEKFRSEHESDEHPEFSRAAWRREVAADNVISGYWEWALSQAEQKEQDIIQTPFGRYHKDQCEKVLFTRKGPKSLSVVQQVPGVFSVEYGGATTAALGYDEACNQLGRCLFNALVCEGGVELA